MGAAIGAIGSLFGGGKKAAVTPDGKLAAPTSGSGPIITALSATDPRRRKPASAPSRDSSTGRPTILSDKLGS